MAGETAGQRIEKQPTNNYSYFKGKDFYKFKED